MMMMVVIIMLVWLIDEIILLLFFLWLFHVSLSSSCWINRRRRRARWRHVRCLTEQCLQTWSNVKAMLTRLVLLFGFCSLRGSTLKNSHAELSTFFSMLFTFLLEQNWCVESNASCFAKKWSLGHIAFCFCHH